MDIDAYIKRRDNLENTPPPPSITKEEIMNQLEASINKQYIPEYLTETKNLYIDFTKSKLNLSNGREKYIKQISRNFRNFFENILIKLEHPITNTECKQVELIAKKDFPQYQQRLLIQFYSYSCLVKNITSENEYIFMESYPRNTKLKDPILYTPEIYNLYFDYSKIIDSHIKLSLNSRHHANMWVYIIMLLTNCWRASDIICEMPNLDLDNINIFSLDWFDNNILSEEQSHLIIEQLKMKLKYTETGKTKEDLVFLVIPELELALSHAVIISELHRRKVKNHELEQKKTLLGTFWTGKKTSTITYFTKPRGYSNHFFNMQPNLKSIFSAHTLNCSTMTYLFFHITENGDTDAALALEFSQLARSHKKGSSSTETYIHFSNKDGSIDTVSVNLFKRGHFGWLYNFLIAYVTNHAGIKQSLVERTKTIESMKDEYSLLEVEEWASILTNLKKGKHSIISNLIKMDIEKLKELIIKIYAGKMPSKDGSGQCLKYPDCPYTQRMKCIGCYELIPQYQVLSEAKREFYRLINSINTGKTDAILKRDSFFLLNVILIFDEAAKSFGSEKINAYLPKEERSKLLNQIIEKLQIN